MPFKVWVYSANRDAFPTADVASDRIPTRELRAAIAREADAKEMGFTAGGWGVFLSDHSGAKIGGDKFANLHVVKPAVGDSDVNVWVERIAPPLAASGGEWLGRWFYRSTGDARTNLELIAAAAQHV